MPRTARAANIFLMVFSLGFPGGSACLSQPPVPWHQPPEVVNETWLCRLSIQPTAVTIIRARDKRGLRRQQEFSGSELAEGAHHPLTRSSGGHTAADQPAWLSGRLNEEASRSPSRALQVCR